MTPPREGRTIRLLSLAARNFLDDADPRAEAHRAFVAGLGRAGIAVEVLTGSALAAGPEGDPSAWLAARGRVTSRVALNPPPDAPPPPWPYPPSHLRTDVDGLPLHLLRGPSTLPHQPDDAELAAFLSILDHLLDIARPDALLAHEADRLTAEALRRGRSRGLPTALRLRHRGPHDPHALDAADALLAPSHALADELAESTGRPCSALPDFVDPARVRAESGERTFLVFVDPTPANGLPAFARIADELGRIRPDIPLLVVAGSEGRGHLDRCGLDLRRHGNVHLMRPPSDPRLAWARARAALAPALDGSCPPPAAIEALLNGLPVVASDRGGLPEALGRSGIALPLPDRLTPATGILPTAEEVAPWVEAILRFWDDPGHYAEQRRLAAEEAGRWEPEAVAARYAEAFARVAPPAPSVAKPRTPRPVGRDDSAVAALARAFPWPDRRPDVETAAEHPGWLGAGTDLLLARELSSDTRLVVELGAWRGLSARFIADHAPNAVVVSVDHWQGSPEHRAGEQFRSVLPTLYETFLAECWAYRDRVIPLRMTSLAGLQAVADRGLRPDLVYVDAEHSYEAVRSEIDASARLFPEAALVGDDYDWDGVRRAVDEAARIRGWGVERVGERGWKLIPGPERTGHPAIIPPGRARVIALVPHLNGIEPECEDALRGLERAGVRVARRRGSSAIDVARNEMASDALHDGSESILFIDADIGFDPADALRLLARPEPVVAGLYAKKGRRELASTFADGVDEVRFGPDSPGPYPLAFAATGFLRIRAHVLRRMVAELGLPLCNRDWGRGCWPFFLPLVVPRATGNPHYLGEDWAFSHRLRQIGVTPLADASIRLWHHGPYAYGWEDAGAERQRYPSYRFRP